MAVRKLWTLDSLERACRKALVDRARLKEATLTHTYQADVRWTPGETMKVRLDKYTCALIDGTVHEMLHDVLDGDIADRFAPDAEEIIVAALEAVLALRIKNSRKRLLWWRRAINGKLPK